MKWWIPIAPLALLAAACSPVAQPTTTTTTSIALTTSTQPPSTEFCLSGDLPFRADGIIATLGEDSGDATSISQIRADRSPTCERLTVEFGTVSGAPATTLGPAGVSVIPYAGITRITLPDEIVASQIADALLEGPLIQSVFVVKDEFGLLSIDLHAKDEIPIEARAFTTLSPATLVIDIARTGTDAVPVGVTHAGTVVIVEPAPGPSQYPISVSGYAAPGMHRVDVQLLNDDAVVAEVTLTLSGLSDTWQAFSTRIKDGPSGSSVVFVGQLDDNALQLDGALVSVTME